MNPFRADVRGPLLLTVWAFAPPVPLSTSDGDTISFSVGAMQGQYEVISRSCEGEILSADAIPVRTGTIMAEYVSDDGPIRISVFGGASSARVPGSADPEVDAAVDDGGFVGGVAAYEGRRGGFGIGAVWTPDSQSGPYPSAYLRLGDREGGYFQSDFLAPTPIPGATGILRAGVGLGLARGRLFFGFGGIRGMDIGESAENAGAFAEWDWEVSPELDVLIGASWFSSEVHPDWGAGVGLRWTPAGD